MEASYFNGPECDWLRNQVAAVLWQPNVVRVRPADSLPLRSFLQPQPLKKKPKDSRTFGEWMAAEDELERLSTVTTKERHGAVTRTWQSTAPDAAAMSVEDYNRWRGESPANAAHAPYVFQKYPTTLYKDGHRIKVGNADDHDRLAGEGWKESP